MNEYEMQMQVYHNLLNVSIVECVDIETSMGGHYADITYIQHDTVYALELKLQWCTRGIEQAKLYQLFGANYAAVVTRRQKVPRKHLAYFEEHGVGLAFFIPSYKRDVRIGCCHYEEYVKFHYPFEWVIQPRRVEDADPFTTELKEVIRFVHKAQAAIWRQAVEGGMR